MTDTAFYDSMAAVAAELIDKYGAPMALRRTTGATYDPVAGVTTPGVSAELPTKGVFRGISSNYAAAFEVQQGDRLAIVDASQEPALTDLLAWGPALGTAWHIVRIAPINPAGIPIAYTVQVRK